MTFCVVEFSYFGLCKVPCMEGLRSSAVYLGDFPRWDKLGAIDKILNTKVARWACAGRAPGKRSPMVLLEVVALSPIPINHGKAVPYEGRRLETHIVCARLLRWRFAGQTLSHWSFMQRACL